MDSHYADNPLKLLKEELESTLRQAQLALQSYLEDSAATAALAAVADAIDQVRGAFSMLDWIEAARLMEEMGNLIQGLLREEVEQPVTARELLLQGILQAPLYLPWLQSAPPHKPFNFLSLVNELRAARGVGLLTSSEWVGARPAAAGVEQDGVSLVELTTQVRPPLQRALLGVLRRQDLPGNLRRIADVFGQLRQAARNESTYRLWWLAEALVLELRDGGIELGRDASLVLRDLDHQLKQLLEKSGATAMTDMAEQGLTQRLVSLLSGSDRGLARLENQDTYQPPQGLAAMGGLLDVLPPDAETLQQIAGFLQESLVPIKDSIDRLARNGECRAGVLYRELEPLQPVVNILTLVNMDIPATLIRQQLETLRRQDTANPAVSDGQLAQLASELILVEDSLDGLTPLAYSQEWAQPVTGQSTAEAGVRLLKEFKAQQARAVVAQDAIAGMEQAREFAAVHLNSVKEAAAWGNLQPLLHQVRGALAILECERADALLIRLEGVVQALTAGEFKISGPVFVSAFAETVVALEYYLKGWEDGKTPDEDILGHADQQLGLLEGWMAEDILVQPEELAFETAELEPVRAAVAEAAMLPLEAVLETPPVAMTAEPDPETVYLDQELVQVFLEEALEILDASDGILQRWGADGGDAGLLNNLRRAMHTLKGSSRMAGFMVIGDLAHAMESLLDAVATGRVAVSDAVTDGLQRALDRLNAMVAQAQRTETLAAAEDLINMLNRLWQPDAEPVQPVLQPSESRQPTRPTPAVAAAVDTVRVGARLLDNLVNQMGESSICRARVDQRVGALGFNLVELEQTVVRLRQQLRRLAIETESQILFRHETTSRQSHADFDPLELDRFSELQQLSRSLMEGVDDLSSIQTHLEEQIHEIGFLVDQQGKVNKEIQQGLMRTRLVRFDSVVPRLRRIVRQSSQELGRPAELFLEGMDAEVERGVLENIVAPLEHLLRNAVAHGIETPVQRRAAGKPETGTISLALGREGSELVLRLSDDGAGLDFEAIRAKGEKLGLLQPGQAASEQELVALLLRPGFSTATQLTQVAGRGVGLDVLNDAVKAMRGVLQIQSRRGQGASFIIRLPFSLALTQALLVKVGGELYAVPALGVEAVTRLAGEEWQAYLGGEAVTHKYGDRRYAVHSLGILFGDIVPQNIVDPRPPALLFHSAESSAALQVEAVLGSQEIMVKPVPPQLLAVPGVSGATVLGDGRVVVVLELSALVRKIGSQERRQAETRLLSSVRQEVRQVQGSVLIVDDSITVRKVTARLLERHHLKATTARDGVDAVALLEEQVPDLVILDIEMPRMDGYELVAHIRSQPHLKHLPVIMVTSRSGEKHRERAARLGVNDYLSKPYQEEQLLAAVHNALDERWIETVGACA